MAAGGGWEVGREERRGIPNPRLMIPCRREIMDVFLQTLDGWVYIVPYMGL
jgi:hypothetical protein